MRLISKYCKFLKKYPIILEIFPLLSFPLLSSYYSHCEQAGKLVRRSKPRRELKRSTGTTPVLHGPNLQNSCDFGVVACSLTCSINALNVRLLYGLHFNIIRNSSSRVTYF